MWIEFRTKRQGFFTQQSGTVVLVDTGYPCQLAVRGRKSRFECFGMRDVFDDLLCV